MEKVLERMQEELLDWSRLRSEQDGRAVATMEKVANMSMQEMRMMAEALKKSEVFDEREPSDFASIEKLCPFPKIDKQPDNYEDRLKGAIVGRFAGCVLGVPVENYSIKRMQEIAKESNTPFPPTEYWRGAENPDGVQYGVDKRLAYTLAGMDGVPVDDDITYTVLNMLLLKRYGEKYTSENVAQLWKELLPYACTAEDSALKKLQAGGKAADAAEGNAFVEWIGAAIRADAFGYVAAGNPTLAAKMCYNDAYVTHRRNGIYGEMFAAAAIAAAFAETPMQAIKTGALCIPEKCRLRQDLDWALSWEGKIVDYRHARALIDQRFEGMHCVHVENNMCAMVFAVMLGGGDFTETIAQSVAIGLDNDCNAATAGSIVGAYAGIGKIPSKWYLPFGDSVRTYLKGYEKISLTGIVSEFAEIRKSIMGSEKNEG